MRRKWNIVNDNSISNYGAGNEIICNTEVLKSYLCDYNDAYIWVRGDITIIGHQSTLAFKNCAPFTKYMTKINKTTIYDAENLDLVMAMYNQIEYSSNYSKTTGSSWFYSKDEGTHFNADIANTGDGFKSVKYKPKLLENTNSDGANGVLKHVTIGEPLNN